LTWLEALAVLSAGAGAGTINAVVGSGTLITFPVLLAVGYPPLLANVSNNVGLVPGSVAAAFGYRRELAGQWRRTLRLAGASVVGSVIGAIALLLLPDDAFRAIVPAFIALALVLVVLQPRLSRRLAERPQRPATRGGPATTAAVGLTGVYGGYFGAAQGVILVALLGIALPEPLQRVNAAKNVLAAAANGTAALIFVSVAEVSWTAALLIAVGSSLGALLGARYGRRLPAGALRGLIVVVGLAAMAQLILG
jgi:uncharacterized membrane protein YfcA